MLVFIYTENKGLNVLGNLIVSTFPHSMLASVLPVLVTQLICENKGQDPMCRAASADNQDGGMKVEGVVRVSATAAEPASGAHIQNGKGGPLLSN